MLMVISGIRDPEKEIASSQENGDTPVSWVNCGLYEAKTGLFFLK
jgi:hypothetical protein